ncbi:MAG: trx3 [Verrucomicrobia bacterium]|jgi:thioredoxin 1|nr:trx3 [Verrucomicrobiota bacterium]
MKTIADLATFNAEVLKHNGKVLVDFYTDRCTPCKMMVPVLEEIVSERPDLKIVKVDAGNNFEVATEFGITTVPTFLVVDKGQVKGQRVGQRSKNDLLKWVDSAV